MAMIRCRNGPDLWGWGAEKETAAVLIWSEPSQPSILWHIRKIINW